VPLLKSLRTVLVCACLEVGLLAGVPMRPEQIEDFMRQMNRPKLAHALPDEKDHGDDPPAKRR
jgi:hypothetical protein